MSAEDRFDATYTEAYLTASSMRAREHRADA
jgi:hypothetical protein